MIQSMSCYRVVTVERVDHYVRWNAILKKESRFLVITLEKVSPREVPVTARTLAWQRGDEGP